MSTPTTSPITTHILDTSRGVPAAGVAIALAIGGERGEFNQIAQGKTDADGRLRDLLAGTTFETGTYRLTFYTGSYFEALGQKTFFPAAVIVFTVDDTKAHYHVPLLISPFGYSTYRGS